MAWAIDTRDLTSINSFEQAEKHWNEEKGWKNQHTSWRPLAGRRKEHMHMVKLSRGGYECVLYGSPIVTYYPEGDAKLTTYDTQSTQMFAWKMKPKNCKPVSHHGKMFWQIETPHGLHYQRETTMIEPSAMDCTRWTVTNPGVMETEWALDHKKAAEVRKIIKPYKDWYEMTARLMGNNRHFTTNHWNRERCIEKLLDEPMNFEAYPEIMGTIGHPDNFRKYAYEQYGARIKQPVPYDRLPKEMA